MKLINKRSKLHFIYFVKGLINIPRINRLNDEGARYNYSIRLGLVYDEKDKDVILDTKKHNLKLHYGHIEESLLGEIAIDAYS